MSDTPRFVSAQFTTARADTIRAVTATGEVWFIPVAPASENGPPPNADYLALLAEGVDIRPAD